MPIFERLPPAMDDEQYTIVISKEQAPYLEVFYQKYKLEDEIKEEFIKRILVQRGIEQLQSDFSKTVKEATRQSQKNAAESIRRELSLLLSAIENLKGSQES